MTQSLSPTLAVGVIVRPHGVRGEVKIQPMTDTAADWLHIHVVEWKDRSGQLQHRKVKHQRVQGDMVLAQIEGIYDRNAAELMRGVELYVPRGEAPQLEENSYYIVDLIGCRVEDENGNEIGEVRDVYQPGGNDVYEIKGAKGVILMPAVRHAIHEVAVSERKIVVDAVAFAEVAVYED